MGAFRGSVLTLKTLFLLFPLLWSLLFHHEQLTYLRQNTVCKLCEFILRIVVQFEIITMHYSLRSTRTSYSENHESFLTTYTLVVKTHSQRSSTVRTEEVIVVVNRNVAEDPDKSICHCAPQLELIHFVEDFAERS